MEIDMVWMRLLLVGCVVLGLSGCGSPTDKKAASPRESSRTEPGAGDKKESTPSGGDVSAAAASNKDRIVGAWKISKSERRTAPGSLVELTKDGKIKMTVKVQGSDFMVAGTYKVEGDRITITTREEGEDKTDSFTILKLTDTELEIKDEKGKTDVWKKKS
jgi:uncharacterized protein (TIGR03066 family)